VLEREPLGIERRQLRVEQGIDHIEGRLDRVASREAAHPHITWRVPALFSHVRFINI
jgi:hypothetical protein